MHRMLRNTVKNNNPDKLGLDLGIIAGDIVYALAIDAFLFFKETPKRMQKALRYFVQTAAFTAMGEFVDIEMYANENDLAGMMSVLYRPITETQGNRYNIEPYDADIHMDNKKLFEKLSVNVANPIAVFFWNLGSEQMQTIHQYSEKEMQDNQ